MPAKAAAERDLNAAQAAFAASPGPVGNIITTAMNYYVYCYSIISSNHDIVTIIITITMIIATALLLGQQDPAEVGHDQRGDELRGRQYSIVHNNMI